MEKYIILLFLGLSTSLYGQQKMKTDTFTFVFEGKRLSGLIDLPVETEPTSMIVLVPGSGRTNIVARNGFYELRKNLSERGVICIIWDKAGCGKSEGIFNYNQPVQNSAEEIITAIEAAKLRHVPGSSKTGLWGISRAGWICPLVISQYPAIAFWISVSGTDDKDNYGYLLQKNFVIEGKSEAEAKNLMDEWRKGIEVARRGGNFEDNLKATENLRKEPFYIFMSGNSQPTLDGYLSWQKGFKTGENIIDKKSGLQIYVPGFEKVLNKIQCPVLAIFGEKDSQVDWHKTMALYNRTLGKNKESKLTIKTMPNGNHNMEECKTGGYREVLISRQPCHGYYETMLAWLIKNGFTA
jgi:pimeloyl-ACP methyl ester carboxylesterase